MSDDPNPDATAEWQEQVDRLIAALDAFSPRDGLSIFTEWLADQTSVTARSGSELGVEGYEEFYLAPEEQGQDTIFMIVQE